MQETKIIVDNRERNLEIASGLAARGVNVTVTQLPVGDYILSDRMCVERKTVRDFENSLIDTRLFEQAGRLNSGFSRPALLIEGDQAEFSLKRNVITGTILRLYSEYNLQILFSASPDETAYMLTNLAEKEQSDKGRMPRLAGRKKAYNLYQWQLLILESIPGVGPKLARDLILHFKTLRNIATSNVEELMEVNKIGRKKAARVYEILNGEFELVGITSQ